jgi:hypothetical protein
VNSEELELSLRTEFENYLKEVFGEMRQEIAQLQERVEADLEKQKSQLNEVFTNVLSRFETDKELDVSFKETVIEHLRLAKDEGAKITATAIAQAEELEREAAAAAPPVPVFGVKEIHEGVNDISQKTSQSDILKTLVHHASAFASRGAFFIIKNEHLVGWRVFGKDKGTVVEEKVREVFMPVSANSILGQSVKSLQTVENDSGYLSDDAEVFEKLEFGEPSKMVAIPLVARGRGVAVLYADGDTENSPINVEALETLIRVAGLTVEVLAAAKAPSTKKSLAKKNSEVELEEDQPSFKTGELPQPVETFEPTNFQPVVSDPVVETPSTPEKIEEPSFVTPEPIVETSYQTSFETDSYLAPSYQTETVEEIPPAMDFVEEFQEEPKSTNNFAEEALNEFSEPTRTVEFEDEMVGSTEEKYPEFETSSSWSTPVETTSQSFSAQEFAANFAKETDPSEYAKDVSDASLETTTDFAFETPSETEVAETPVVEEFVPTKEQTYGSFEVENGKAETVSEPISTPPAKSRLSERNVDLPIEVSEDERRLHNDARRFARLLVSEIKLYNEQKVKEGRDSSDLYARLKEAIDRSREMYDKRVQPPVAAKFDYFHYELVNTLAEGDDNKLGTAYPGSAV